MNFADYAIPTETVETPNGSWAVRGLGLEDIAFLVRQHGPILRELYSQMAEGKFDVEDVSGVIDRVLTQAPQLAALIIAAGGDAPEHAAKAAKLSISVQTDALEKIFRLTFNQEGGAKKVLETVALAMGSLNNLGLPER